MLIFSVNFSVCIMPGPKPGPQITADKKYIKACKF
jgi:hypothetical protein